MAPGRRRAPRRRRAAQALAAVAICLLGECTAWRKWTEDGDGPEARRGHSLVMFGNRAVLFGGKGNDRNALHIPKTFELVSNDGKLEFASYDQLAVPKGSREVIPLVENDEFLEQCVDAIDTDPAAVANNSKCNFDGAREDIHNKDNYIPISMYFNDVWWYDLDCERFADDGCTQGGWLQLDPGARLGGCELVQGKEICTHPNERYGHSAQIINDEFMVVYGGFSQFCHDFCDDAWLFALPRHATEAKNADPRWIELEQLASPGKRWNSASTLVDSATILLFGGHRLWHGFSKDNSRSNRWSSREQLPTGGYLSDMWTWNLDSCLWPGVDRAAATLSDLMAHYRLCKADWREITPKKNCTNSALLDNGQLRPGYTWEQRHEQLCFSVWPPPRSGHGMAFFKGQLYLYGGYRTFFPYPTTKSAGWGVGTTTSGTGAGYIPFPSFDYYLTDFWRFDIESGYWHIVEAVGNGPDPGARTQHAFLASRDLLVLFGGYRSNHFLDDFWYFNTTSRRWLQKSTFVHPIYPENCTAGGTVVAYPTRGTVVDGKFGRASEHIAVNLTRRQAPGWDGCRDRADGRASMPWELQWERPSQRSNHAVAFSDKYELLLSFGGHGVQEETLEQVEITMPIEASGELWQFNMHQCVTNCSGHGDCLYGFCRCHSGYYGLDCSNSSCPGDFCYYDEVKNEQICTHCCHAPYVHTDADVYIPDFGKRECSLEEPGRSNGVCDGNGKCLCAPPFVGLDCSIKDCKDDCSGNGWCAHEYPVSRCHCNPGFTGESCEFMECLNNCSYPNGICDIATGTCNCMMWPNPYDRYRPWRRFEGMDCSFLIPFAGASRIVGGVLRPFLLAFVLPLAALLL